MPSLRPVPPRSNPAERTAALQRKEDYSMSHHYSGPDFGFPQGDARLDFTDLYAFPKPGETGKSILIVNVHPSAGENPPGPTACASPLSSAEHKPRVSAALMARKPPVPAMAGR